MNKIWMQTDYEKACGNAKTLEELVKLKVLFSVIPENFTTYTEDEKQYYLVTSGKRRFKYISIGGCLFTPDGQNTCYRVPYPHTKLYLKTGQWTVMTSDEEKFQETVLGRFKTMGKVHFYGLTFS